MNTADIEAKLAGQDDIVRLDPQVIGRFYGDANRLGQRSPKARTPAYYKPERWIGSSTLATNPPGIPSGGVSTCKALRDGGRKLTLKQLVAHPQFGPRLLGEDRYRQHDGSFRVLIKLLDAQYPIPFHVHADDAFVWANPNVYPKEQCGKDEAYHFLDVDKGTCPYTHLGVYPGVGPKQVVAAMRRGTDHVIELSRGALQRFGEGFIVKAGLLHRPGSALTLEIQQPSDVYTFFQTDFGGQPLPEEALYPGFDSIEEAAERVINWQDNLQEDLLEATRLTPTSVEPAIAGGRAEWIYPPQVSDKFSGMRLTVEQTMRLRAEDPFLLFVWKGAGTLNGHAIEGGGGRPTTDDEAFIGRQAAQRGIEIANTGDQPLVVFALFAAKV